MSILNCRVFLMVMVVFGIPSIPSVSLYAQVAEDGKENQAVVDEQARKKRIALELRRLLQEQGSKVNVLEARLRSRALSLNMNLQEMSSLRANIRASLRTYVLQDYLVLSSGAFGGIMNRIILSLPSYASFNFAMYEIAEMKNKQARLRLQKGAFENLNRQYVREALELERLNLLMDFVKEGQPVTIEMLSRPKSFLTPEEQNAIANKGDESPESSSDLQKGRIMFGTPKVGDNVTPKSKSIYLLRDESEAESLMLRPSSYSLTRLVGLAQKNLAAKFDPGQHAKVLIEGEHLLKIKVEDPDSMSNLFVGWVEKGRVVRYRENVLNKTDIAKDANIGKEAIVDKVVLADMPKNEPVKIKVPKTIKSDEIVKLPGLPVIGSNVTAETKAIGLKTNYELKEYLMGRKDPKILERFRMKNDVVDLDDTIVGRVVAIEYFDDHTIFQVIIESSNSSLDNTTWWVNLEDIVVCSVK